MSIVVGVAFLASLGGLMIEATRPEAAHATQPLQENDLVYGLAMASVHYEGADEREQQTVDARGISEAEAVAIATEDSMRRRRSERIEVFLGRLTPGTILIDEDRPEKSERYVYAVVFRGVRDRLFGGPFRDRLFGGSPPRSGEPQRPVERIVNVAVLVDALTGKALQSSWV